MTKFDALLAVKATFACVELRCVVD